MCHPVLLVHTSTNIYYRIVNIIITYEYVTNIIIFLFWSKLDARNMVKTSDYLYLKKEIDFYQTFENVRAQE